MKKILFILLMSLLISGCVQKKSETENLNGEKLNSLVERAVNGSISANDSLAGIFVLSYLEIANYNKIKIDSLILPTNEKYFTLLAEYPVPVYNRFAVYDDSLKVLLIDKSLSGVLSEEIVELNNEKYIKINEGFISKDLFDISRLTLYKVKNDSAYTVLRIFTRLREPEAEYTQLITRFSDSLINTFINSTRRNFSEQHDTFLFNTSRKTYESAQKVFENFVMSKIENAPGGGTQ